MIWILLTGYAHSKATEYGRTSRKLMKIAIGKGGEVVYIPYLRPVLRLVGNEQRLSTVYEGAFGWAFTPAFTFAKAKSQPKGLNALGAFAQKQLLP
jgi:hypothetical protein